MLDYETRAYLERAREAEKERNLSEGDKLSIEYSKAHLWFRSHQPQTMQDLDKWFEEYKQKYKSGPR